MFNTFFLLIIYWLCIFNRYHIQLTLQQQIIKMQSMILTKYQLILLMICTVFKSSATSPYTTPTNHAGYTDAYSNSVAQYLASLNSLETFLASKVTQLATDQAASDTATAAFNAADPSDNAAFAAALFTKNSKLSALAASQTAHDLAETTRDAAQVSYDAAVAANSACPFSGSGTYQSSASYTFDTACMDGCNGYDIPCIPALILDADEKFLCGTDQPADTCYSSLQFTPISLDSANLCPSQLAAVEYVLLQDDCITAWDGTDQSIKEDSNFPQNGIIRVDEADATVDILRVNTDSTACVQMTWQCATGFKDLTFYQQVVVTYKWGLGGIDTTKVPFYGQQIAATNYTGDLVFMFSYNDPTYYHNLLSMYKTQTCEITPAIAGVTCPNFANNGEVTMNVPNYVASNGWNSRVETNIKISDTADSSQFLQVALVLRLCGIDHTDPSVYQQHYPLGYGQVSPTYSNFELFFKQHFTEVACATNMAWNFQSMTPSSSPIAYTGIASSITNGYLTVETDVTFDAKVVVYKETSKPASETATYGVNYFGSYFTSFYISVGTGVISSFVDVSLTSADITKEVVLYGVNGIAWYGLSNFVCDIAVGCPGSGSKEAGIWKLSSSNTELTPVSNLLGDPTFNGPGQILYSVDDRVLGNYQFYIYGATQVDATGNFDVTYAAFSPLITLSVVCGGETITVTDNNIMIPYMNPAGSTEEFLISTIWNVVSDMTECPVARYETWLLQGDGTWAQYNSHVHFTLINGGDPATAAVQVDTTTPFALDGIIIVAFTTGEAASIPGVMTFILSVCGAETIFTWHNDNTNPYYVTGQKNDGVSITALLLSTVFFSSSPDCGMSYLIFEDAALTIPYTGTKVTISSPLQELDVTFADDEQYSVYIQGIASIGLVSTSIQVDVLICPETIDELNNTLDATFYAAIDSSYTTVVYEAFIPKMPQCFLVTSYSTPRGPGEDYGGADTRPCNDRDPADCIGKYLFQAAGDATLNVYVGEEWNAEFDQQIKKTFESRYAAYKGITYEYRTFTAHMNVIQRTLAAWITAPDMTAFVDYKIYLGSDGSTGVNDPSSNIIEFGPFVNTYATTQYSETGAEKEVDLLQTSTDDTSLVPDLVIGVPVLQANGNYQITIPSDTPLSFPISIFGETSIESTGFYASSNFYQLSALVTVSVVCGGETDISDYEPNYGYLIGGAALPLLPTGSAKGVQILPQITSSYPTSCPILQFLPFGSNNGAGPAYAAASSVFDGVDLPFTSTNLVFDDPSPVGFISQIQYDQDTPYVHEFYMRAHTDGATQFGYYFYYHFIIIICGDEDYTLVNTAQYRQQWSVVQAGNTFTIPFSEYQGWFGMVLQGNVTRLCEMPYELRDETCTIPYSSTFVQLDAQQDIVVNMAAPFLRQNICLFSESKGLKTIQKIIDFEICGVRMEPFIDQPIVTFNIDGSVEPKELLEVDLRAFFNLLSDYCLISHFELLQIIDMSNPDLYNAANFQKHNKGKYIRFKDKENLIEIRQNDKELSGMQKGEMLNVTKYLKAVTIYGDYAMQTLNFNFVKTYNKLPQFIGLKEFKEWEVEIDQKKILKGNSDPIILELPKTKDQEDNEVTVMFENPEMFEWITLQEDEDNEGEFSLVIEPSGVQYTNQGTHQFNILLMDDKAPGVFNRYRLVLQLTYIQFAYADIISEVKEQKQNATKKSVVKEILFDEQIPRPTIQIGNFTVDHMLSLVFDQNMEVNKSLDFSKVLQFKTINGLNDRVTTGRYQGSRRILSQDIDGPNQNFGWEVTVHEPKLITFQVNYEDITQVSTISKDQMVITVLDLSQLRSQATLAPLNASSIVGSSSCGTVKNSMCQTIPAYLDEGTKKSIDSATKIIEGSISALIQANIFLMIPLGKSLSSLWDIIRPLQYLSIIALITVIYPSQLHVFFKNMIDISSLDLFFGAEITEYLFKFNAGQEPYSDHFEEFGVDSTVYLLNSSSIIIPIVPLIITQYLLLKMMKRLIKNRIDQPLLRRLGMYIGLLDQDIFSTMSKVLLEGSFDLTFCTLINLYSILMSEDRDAFMLNFNTWSDFINTTTTFISFFVVIMFMPILGIFNAFRYFFDDSLTIEDQRKISRQPLFAENTQLSFSGMIYESIYMIRRTITIAMIIFCPYSIFQIQIMMWMSIFNCMYFIHSKPLYFMRDQVINELTILLVCYGFYILIDISVAYEGKSFVGMAVLMFITLNIVFNVSKAAINTGSELYKAAKEAKQGKKKIKKDQEIFEDFKKVAAEYPGMFPVTEYLIQENEAILRSNSWNAQKQWLVQHGFQYSHLPEHKQFLIEIRKFKFYQNNEILKSNSQIRFVAKKFMIKDQLKKGIKGVALPEVIENKFDRKWGRKQEKKMAPIQEVREHTDEKNDSDEEFDSDEQPQILKQLRYLASFPEKIYITQDYEKELDELQEAMESIKRRRQNQDKLLIVFQRVYNHYEYIEEQNQNVIKQSRQKDYIFLQELEEKLTDNVYHQIYLSDNEEQDFLKNQDVIQQISAKNQKTQTKQINDQNKILQAQNKELLNPFAGASIFGLKSSSRNVSSVLCCLQCLFSLKLPKDYYMKKLYGGHSPSNTTSTIANFLKDTYRDASYLRLDPSVSRALEVNLDEISNLPNEDPLFFFYQLLKQSSQEMQEKKRHDVFESQQIRKHVIYLKKQNFSYLSKLFALQLNTRNICGQCKDITQTFKNEFGLNIKIQEQETSLTQLLATNLSTQEIESECKCGGNMKYIQRAITVFPYYLIVGLQRFDEYGNRRSVLKHPVVVHQEMDLSQCASEELVKEMEEGKDIVEVVDARNTPHMQKLQMKIDEKVQKAQKKYELQAIICHNGTSMSTGQFYCYVKRITLPQSLYKKKYDVIEEEFVELFKLGGRAELFAKKKAKKIPEPVILDTELELKHPKSRELKVNKYEITQNHSDEDALTEGSQKPIDMGDYKVYAKPKSKQHLFKKIKSVQMEGGDLEPKPKSETSKPKSESSKPKSESPKPQSEKQPQPDSQPQSEPQTETLLKPQQKPQPVEDWYLFLDDYHTKVDITEVLKKEKLNIYMVLYKAH